MTDPTDSGQETVQDVTIESLVKKNGTAEMPIDFGTDGNALALVCTTKNALKREGWPREDITTFSKLALSDDYNCVVTSCLRVLGKQSSLVYRMYATPDDDIDLKETLNKILNPKDD